MKTLVIGATGAVGRRVSAELAQASEVTDLILAARNESAAARIATVLGADRVRSTSVDLTDTAPLIALARDVDVVVSAAGPYYLYEIDTVRAMIEAGTNYVSLCDDHVVTDRVLALDDSARDAGITVVSGCGMSPGLTNLLVSLAASGLDSVEEIDVAVAASSADTPGAATALHFLAQMSTTAPAISDHSPEEVPAGTVPRLVYFPEPVGWVETFRSGHPEISTLPRAYPELRSLRFRIGLTERAAMDVIRASATARLLATEKQRRMWLRMTEPLRPALEVMPPRGAAWTAARVDVRGYSESTPAGISLAFVDHLTNLAAVPLARAAIEVAGGHCRAGVVTPEEAFDAADFLYQVGERGIRVARLDPVRV